MTHGRSLFGQHHIAGDFNQPMTTEDGFFINESSVL
jgi:hypothetical protein